MQDLSNYPRTVWCSGDQTSSVRVVRETTTSLTVEELSGYDAMKNERWVPVEEGSPKHAEIMHNALIALEDQVRSGAIK
jgi:hypothetical protein